MCPPAEKQKSYGSRLACGLGRVEEENSSLSLHHPSDPNESQSLRPPRRRRKRRGRRHSKRNQGNQTSRKPFKNPRKTEINPKKGKDQGFSPRKTISWYVPPKKRLTVDKGVVVDEVVLGDVKEKERHHPRESGRGRARGRGRAFDRHSMTDMRDSEKKSIAGKGTWGAPGSEIQLDQTMDSSHVDSPPLEEEKEPQVSYMTLQDYQESQKAKRVQVSSGPARQANEGVDEKKWAGKVHEKMDDTEALFAGKVRLLPSLFTD